MCAVARTEHGGIALPRLARACLLSCQNIYISEQKTDVKSISGYGQWNSNYVIFI
jgi:hypothetical protein